MALDSNVRTILRQPPCKRSSPLEPGRVRPNDSLCDPTTSAVRSRVWGIRGRVPRRSRESSHPMLEIVLVGFPPLCGRESGKFTERTGKGWARSVHVVFDCTQKANGKVCERCMYSPWKVHQCNSYPACIDSVHMQQGRVATAHARSARTTWNHSPLVVLHGPLSQSFSGSWLATRNCSS